MGLFGKEPDISQMQGSRNIDGLVKALGHHKKEIRRQAAEALGRLKDTSSIEPMMELLKDSSDEARSESMCALSGLWDDRICQAVVPILSDKNAARLPVRVQAKLSQARIKSAQS